MSHSMPSGVNFIVKLDITPQFEKFTIVQADGREVYRGDDPEVINRWLQYWREQTPWSEIFEREQKP